MPREENETKEIKGLIGGLVLLGLVCAFVLVLAQTASHAPGGDSPLPSAAPREQQLN